VFCWIYVYIYTHTVCINTYVQLFFLYIYIYIYIYIYYFCSSSKRARGFGAVGLLPSRGTLTLKSVAPAPHIMQLGIQNTAIWRKLATLLYPSAHIHCTSIAYRVTGRSETLQCTLVTLRTKAHAISCTEVTLLCYVPHFNYFAISQCANPLQCTTYHASGCSKTLFFITLRLLCYIYCNSNDGVAGRVATLRAKAHGI